MTSAQTPRYLASQGDTTQVYLGPSSLLLVTEKATVPLILTSVAFSYDPATKLYRWTVSRPLCNGAGLVLDKIARTARTLGEEFGVGIVFNGVEGLPLKTQTGAVLHRTGVWISGCKPADLYRMCSSAMNQTVIDGCSGAGSCLEEWRDPPIKPWTDAEW